LPTMETFAPSSSGKEPSFLRSTKPSSAIWLLVGIPKSLT
jgi:hypothetical protein